jgi:hypothetical protein
MPAHFAQSGDPAPCDLASYKRRERNVVRDVEPKGKVLRRLISEDAVRINDKVKLVQGGGCAAYRKKRGVMRMKLGGIYGSDKIIVEGRFADADNYCIDTRNMTRKIEPIARRKIEVHRIRPFTEGFLCAVVAKGIRTFATREDVTAKATD